MSEIDDFLTDRCDTERLADAGTDPYGEPVPGAYARHLTDLPCGYWSSDTEGRGVQQTPDRDWVPGGASLLVDNGSDIQIGDRVTELRQDGVPFSRQPWRVVDITPGIPGWGDIVTLRKA